MSEQTALCNSSIRRDLNLFALLRFDVVKLPQELFPSFWF